MNIYGGVLVFVAATILTLFGAVVSADRFSSTSYVIDASVMNSAGGTSSSGNYGLTSSTGESIVGDGASASYKMTAGYAAQIMNSDEQGLTLAVQPTGLRAYYPFEEGSGSVIVDGSSNESNGSVKHIGTWAPMDGAWAPGKVGSAFHQESRQRPIVEDTPALHVPDTYTVEMWIKSGDITSEGDEWINLIMKAAGLTRNYGLFIHVPAGKVAMTGSFSGGTQVDIKCNGNILDGQWHHIAYTYTGTEMRCYIDGMLDIAYPQTGAPDTDITDIMTMRAPGIGGMLDEVKVYDRALSDAEVKAEYDAQNAGVASGITFGTVIPGNPVTTGFDIVATPLNTSNYALSINQNHGLQQGAYTIPSIPHSLTAPSAWVDGTTKGLGVSIVSGPAIDSKWSNGANFGAIPTTMAGLYARNNASINVKDTIRARLKLDPTHDAPAGQYTNQVIITGVATP